MEAVGGEAVAEFVQATGCDEATARFFLEANAGHAEKALQMFHEQMQAQQQHEAPAVAAVAPGLPRLPPSPRNVAGERPQPPVGQQRRGLLARLARFPVGILRATFTIAFRTLGLGLELVSFLGRRLLPAPLFRALTRSVEAVARSGEIIDPTVAAEQFAVKFKDAYGEQCPAWQTCPWQEAANRAHREFKFLFVYVHSAQHPATAQFCRDTLCSAEVVEFLNEQVVAWGGDVRFSDAFALATSLRATTYPFVGLLLGSSSRLRLVFTQGGACSAEALRAGLQAAIDEHGAELVVERAEAQEREFNRMLREQQDREYQESLEQDRQREAALEEQRKAEEEAARAQAEEEARIRAEKEAEERRQEEFRMALNTRREKALDVVTVEPESLEPGACPIRIRLPNGSNKQRRFLSSDKVQAIYDFINTDEEFEILKYNLVTNFPHCVYDEEKAKMTIQEAGLAGAMLLVQSLDT